MLGCHVIAPAVPRAAGVRVDAIDDHVHVGAIAVGDDQGLVLLESEFVEQAIDHLVDCRGRRSVGRVE